MLLFSQFVECLKLIETEFEQRNVKLIGVSVDPLESHQGWAGDIADVGGTDLNFPIVGIAATPTGRGYWLVATDGGVFSFGDARFFGSTGSLRLAAPVIDVATTQSGRGYGLLAANGGIFAFGEVVTSLVWKRCESGASACMMRGSEVS